MSTKFDSKELTGNGKLYPTYGTYYGYEYYEAPVLNSPISPRENYLRFIRNGDFEWIPDTMCDIVDITPDINPDVTASGFDGGVDLFGVTWVPVGNGLPSMVRPGSPVLDDICNWREKLVWPDVDSWDWKGTAKAYECVQGSGRFIRGVVLSGYFERLISLMDVENAAMAMVTDEDEVKSFFDKLTDVNLSIIEHYARDLKVDGILMHDDWAAQFAPFFSESTMRECLVPYVKRCVDKAHELGLIFTFHSCGNQTGRVHLICETGADVWQMQANASDALKCLAEADGQLKLEIHDVLPLGLSAEEKLERIKSKMLELSGKTLYWATDPEAGTITPEFRALVYEAGRRTANQVNP